MDSKRSSCLAVFLSINVLFFVIASGCNTCSQPHPLPNPKPSPANGGGSGSNQSCPRDALKLGVCAKLLNGTVGAVIGKPPVTPCCTLLDGLVDLEVAACLCTAIKANVLGININIPVSLSLLLNVCGKNVPKDFQCA